GRGEGRRPRAGAHDPQLGRLRGDRAGAEGQRVHARARAGRSLRRHALGQRRAVAEPRRADRGGGSAAREGSVDDRHRRRRREARGARARVPRAPPRERPLLPLSAEGAAARFVRGSGRARRLAGRSGRVIKRAFDCALAAVGLVVSSPFWIAIAAAITIDDGGPIFYRQARVGLGGRQFDALKFRSMVPDAEARSGPLQAAERDPRVTRVGRLLRATAMDELPQLWNIFVGDMSFVGPRPLRPGEVEARGDGRFVRLDEIPGYEARHSVRPGLTGITQVYAARDIDRARKFRLDRLYLKRAGFWFDLRLILMSFWITARGGWERRDRV